MSFLASSDSTPRFSALAAYRPGLMLVLMTTAAAYGLRELPLMRAVSPMMLAILIGMLFSQLVGVPSAALPGVNLAGKRLLRLAVALLGLQITFEQLAGIGLGGVAAAAAALGLTFLFTVAAGRLLGVNSGLTMLIAGGTAVCGASAIAAVNATVKAEEEDVSYAIACITLFGTVAMFSYPWLITQLALGPEAFGAWVGLSVHEVAQVVGAGYQAGPLAGETAVVTKLARVVMLAPLVVCLALFVARGGAAAMAPSRTGAVPGFVLGFLALAAANSLGIVPEAVRAFLVAATPIMLTTALAALGLDTSFAKVREKGLRPLLLSALAFLFIAATSLLLVKLDV